MFPERTSKCDNCGLCTKDLWCCLVCGNVGCGRESINQCALKHFKDNSNHIYCISMETRRVWDYSSDDYVYRIFQTQKRNELISVLNENGDGHDGSVKHLPRELDFISSKKQELLIYEYNYLQSQQIMNMQQFYMNKLNQHRKDETIKLKVYDTKKDYYTKQHNLCMNKLTKLFNMDDLNDISNQCDKILKDMDTIEDFDLLDDALNNNNNTNNIDMKFDNINETQYSIFVNNKDELVKQLNNEQKQMKSMKALHHKLLKDQKNFPKQLKELEVSLKNSLKMCEQSLNMKINRLDNDLRDFKVHSKGQNKFGKQLTSKEQSNANVKFADGKSKNNKKNGLKKKGKSNLKKHKKSKTHK